MQSLTLFSFFMQGIVNFSFALPQGGKDNGWVSLSDNDLSQWENYLSYQHKTSYNGRIPVDEHRDTFQPVGYNKDKKHVFSIVKENDELLLKVTGEYYGIYQTIL